jgi:glycosyltransferase involved in cell wall biosynthesis
MPRVSVILTSFNHAAYLNESIDSVLGQTFADLELIVLDDASRDNSWSLISRYADRRVRAYLSATPGEVTHRMNHALSSAVGEYIAIQHSDDVWTPEKLGRQVAYLDAHPEVGAVFTWVQVIDETGSKIEEDWFNQPNQSRWARLNELFNEKNTLSHPSALIRKCCCEEVGGYRYGLRQIDDAELWSRLLIRHPIHVLEEKLTLHRLFSDKSNVSSYRPDVAVRCGHEWNFLRENFLALPGFDEIVQVFPELECWRRSSGFNIKFLLATALVQSPHRSAWPLGLRWLLELLNVTTQKCQIAELYGFTDLSLIGLSATLDSYLVGAVAQQHRIVAKYEGKLQGVLSDYVSLRCPLQMVELAKRLAASKRETAAAKAANAVFSSLPGRAVQVADSALTLTLGWANALPKVDMLAHLLTRNRVLLGLLRRRPEDRLAVVRTLAASLHQFVPEEALQRILRRRVLLGLLRRTRSHGKGIVVIEILQALTQHRSRYVEELCTALRPIGEYAGQQPLDVVTARRMLVRLDWLIGLFDPALSEGYRPVMPGPAVSAWARPGNARENVLLVVHETSRTGAPILGWNIALHLSRRYNVFTVTIGDGPLTPSFEKISIETHGPFPPEHRTPVALERHLRPMLDASEFRYAIINSCESRSMIEVCAARGIPTVMLMHEFAASVHNSQSLRDAMDAVDEMVFPAAIVARSAYEVHPALRDRQVFILPQGMCTLPEAKMAPDGPTDPVVGELAKARAEGGFVVLGAGTVEYRKGVDLFLTAAMAVQRDAPELGIRFLWVGHGYRPDEDKGYSAYLREQITRSGLSGSVTLLDAVSDLDPIYAITDTFLLTSRLDPLPNVSIDAACRGIPIICFRDASGTADVLLSDPGTAAGVVDYLDTTQAAAKIVGFARNRASHRRMSAATSALASNVFDMTRYVAAVDALGVGAVWEPQAKQSAGL